MLCIYTYSFLPQAPLGAVSSAAEDKDAQKGYFWEWFLAQVTFFLRCFWPFLDFS